VTPAVRPGPQLRPGRLLRIEKDDAERARGAFQFLVGGRQNSLVFRTSEALEPGQGRSQVDCVGAAKGEIASETGRFSDYPGDYINLDELLPVAL